MDALERLLRIREKDALYDKNHITITTTAGFKQAFLLDVRKEPSFLKTYASLIQTSGLRFHLNVVLNTMMEHCLFFDVDYNKQDEVSREKSLLDARNLYQAVVQEMQQNMESFPEEGTTLYLDCAYLLVRAGSRNFHLVFPCVQISRLDYDILVRRMMAIDFGQLDPSVQGWMLFGSTKNPDKAPYQVEGFFRSGEPFLHTEPHQLSGLKGELVDQSVKKYVSEVELYVNLFYPRASNFRKKLMGHVRYPLILSPRQDESLGRLVLSYSDPDTTPITFIYSALRSNLKEGDQLLKHYFVLRWAKLYQNIFTFKDVCQQVWTCFYKFYPVKLPETSSSSTEVVDIDLTGEVPEVARRLAREYGSCFGAEQILEIVDGYQKFYPEVLEEIECGDWARRSGGYTLSSLVYELVRGSGQFLPSCHLPDAVLESFVRILCLSQAERLKDFICGRVLPLVPFVFKDANDVRVFDWRTRTWGVSLKLKTFLINVFSDMIDYAVQNAPVGSDPRAQANIRKTRKSFITEINYWEGRIWSDFGSHDIKLDNNEWLFGLYGGYTFSVKTGTTRPTIPEDYLSKFAPFPPPLREMGKYDVFLDEGQYNMAFRQLKDYYCGENDDYNNNNNDDNNENDNNDDNNENGNNNDNNNDNNDDDIDDNYKKKNNQTQETFAYTGDKRIDALFYFLATVFCNEYEEMTYLLQYLADCFIGRNFRRHALFLIGETTNGKTTLCQLCKAAFGLYCSTLSPEFFYESKYGSGSGSNPDAAAPEMAGKLGCRLLVVEEMSGTKTMNLTRFCAMTGNNAKYVRQLYQSGSDYDITFNFLFTGNQYPKIAMTDAVKQRIRILRFNSSFRSSEKSYDFEKRSFPQTPNFDIGCIAQPFLELLMTVLVKSRKDRGIFDSRLHDIEIPESVEKNLHHASEVDSSLIRFERQCVAHTASDGFVGKMELLAAFETFKTRHHPNVSETAEELYQLFLEKHCEKFTTDQGEDGFKGLILRETLTSSSAFKR